jgi:fatty acid desaturase
MNNSDKKNLLKWNTILWLAAMVLPAFFSIAFASSKFPWPMVLPFLLTGPMLASNRMLTQAIGQSNDAPNPK